MEPVDVPEFLTSVISPSLMSVAGREIANGGGDSHAAVNVRHGFSYKVFASSPSSLDDRKFGNDSILL